MTRRFALVLLVASVSALAIYLALPLLVERGILDVPTPDGPEPHPELRRLKATWGPETYAERGEDLKIQDFFQGREGGIFVDVGAWEAKRRSTTYLLETHYGWSGLAIDAQAKFAPGYEELRPRTKFFSFYVADTNEGLTEFYLTRNDTQATGSKELADTKKGGYTSVEVPQITLDRLLELEAIESVDFLSMDIELAEPAALRGFDIDRYAPELVCIEQGPEIEGELRAYFARHGYVEIDLWSRLDRLNSFYVRGDLADAFLRRLERSLAEYEASLDSADR